MPSNSGGTNAGTAVYKTSSVNKMASPLGPTTPDPLTQRAVIEGMFERRQVEGEFWYVLVAEWLEQLKKYLAIPGSRKSYHQRVHPGPIITRRDYAHTVEVIHEDAWKLLVQWYGLAEGHKCIKLVVYNYTRAPEIEHNLNNCKLHLTKSPPEDFHNVKFSKMEKVGHVEWKLRQLYNISVPSNTRIWAKPDADADWKPLLVRDRTIGKELQVDSDLSRLHFALEVRDPKGKWNQQPDGAQPTQDGPIGILYDHDLFEDVTTTWELDVHEQIDHIGRDFVERLHLNFNSFVQKAKEFVYERDSVLRERERKACCKETHLDELRDMLEDERGRLAAETEAYQCRRQVLDAREIELQAAHDDKIAALEKEASRRRAEMDREHAVFIRAKETFDNELRRMSEVYKVQENKIKLDIGGHQFTTSLLTLTKDHNSMLSAMFSGRHRLRQESDGSYFIDRDGLHFRYILNYLRDGCIREGTMPNNETLWGELLNEAEYYQLSGLVEYLQSLINRTPSRSDSNMSTIEAVTSDNESSD